MTESAEADLAEIWAYVAADASETTATRLIDKIMAACEQPSSTATRASIESVTSRSI